MKVCTTISALAAVAALLGQTASAAEPAGTKQASMPAPRAAAPGERVSTPYFDFVPKNLPQQANR